MQDLGTAQGPSNSLRSRGIALSDWIGVGGGEAGHVVSAPDNPDVVYAGEYLGYISRFDRRTGLARNVSAWPENPSGHGGEDMRYRFQWTAPIAVSPHDPTVVYHGAQVIFRTTDGGQSWTPISGDLTRNDKSKQKWAGGPITGDNTGVETYGTVFAIAESPKQKDLIWAGSDDGLVHVTRDGGKSWTNVTAAMPGFPEWGTVSMIEPSPFDAAMAYVVVDAHRLDNMRPYLYKTTDYGKSWTRLDGALPQDVYLHVVREDPKKRGLLYLGTERGVMYSTDGGTSWEPLQLNLPTVAVHDLVVKDDNLVVGTHGRSIWILDDLIPIREMSAKIKESAVHVFPVADTICWQFGTGNWGRGPYGENPPRGAAIYYYLKEKPKGDVTVEVRDAQGQMVRRLSSVVREPDRSDDDEEEEREALKKQALQAEEGVQRAVWDLRYEGAKKIQGGKIDWGEPGIGPFGLPGTYTVVLTAGAMSQSTTVRVLPDPRVQVSPADAEAPVQDAHRKRGDVAGGRLCQPRDAIEGHLAERSEPAAGRKHPGTGALRPLLDRHLAHRERAEFSGQRGQGGVSEVFFRERPLEAGEPPGGPAQPVLRVVGGEADDVVDAPVEPVVRAVAPEAHHPAQRLVRHERAFHLERRIPAGPEPLALDLHHPVRDVAALAHDGDDPAETGGAGEPLDGERIAGAKQRGHAEADGIGGSGLHTGFNCANHSRVRGGTPACGGARTPCTFRRSLSSTPCCWTESASSAPAHSCRL
jgi:hypothetical protein